MKKCWIALLAIFVFGTVASAVDFNRRAYDCAPNQEVFVSVLQRFAQLKKDPGNEPQAQYNPTSFSVGYAYDQGMWHAGVAFNFETGNRKLNYADNSSNKGGYEVRTNVPGVSLFGGIRDGQGMYVDAHSFIGFSTYKAKDAWVNGMNAGSGNKNHKTLFAVGVEAGKAFDLGYCGGLTVTPHVGFDYAYAPSERYYWSNTGGFAETSIKSQSYFEIPVGVSVSRTFAVGGWDLTPKADATLVTTLGKVDPYNAHPGFAYRTANDWKVAGISAGRVGARLGAGLDAKMNDRIKVGVGYTFEGRDRYTDHRINANFALSF